VSEITLVRQHETAIPEADKDAARRVLFGIVDGLGERGKKQWRRFINGLLRLEPGEMVEIKTHKARSGPFHRRHMVIETRLFEAQERFEHFEQFRNWLKVGAGFCDWVPGARGAVMPVPRSIAFDKLEEDEMRQVHDDMLAFVRTDYASKTLWKHLTPAQRIEMVEGVLREFDE
jgi:Protein of unknown function (DUF1367)